ncbi:MAG: L-seryl-tRNA(Sec) selenium transferase [Chloroflexi bacterium]|nr:L-seryl-tRNA(Sec) selenium transferase [Chloroflexota bacterium]
MLTRQPGNATQNRFRDLPSVDRLLQDGRVQTLAAEHSRPTVLEAAREVVEEARHRVGQGEPCPSFDELVRELVDHTTRFCAKSLRLVINATGVIIHTNLGRATLSDEAMAAMRQATASYSNLELDLESGERGSRHMHVEPLLARLTGAEAGFAVNNNAAAVLLALSAVARGREVLLSRGQSVEIGGGFRIPDVMRQSGARLVEVGTTNKTYLADYEAAIGLKTGLLLRVHSSNFRITGFVHFVGVAELVRLGDSRGLPVLDDLGSGALLDTEAFGLGHEPTVQESVSAGAALVCFSGDKLLGGPQAGIIVGKREWVERLRKHPLARAVRLDKASIAGLQVTLLHYLRGEALAKIPVWRMISMPVEELAERADRWRGHLAGLPVEMEIVGGESTVGGGSLPGEALPTRLLAIAPRQGGDRRSQTAAAGAIAARLRRGSPAVVGRVERGRLLVDPRTVLPEQEEALLGALRAALETSQA